jgi:DNA-binding LacI/PurR family transcriptional regulator
VTTLRDVAQLAGVSLTTAWRVSNGATNVSAATRDRVQRAMRDLLYVATDLTSPDSTMIGLLVPELANPVFPLLAQALETRAAQAGYSSILCNTEGATFREIDYVHKLLDHRVAGMIFISCEMTNLEGDHSHYSRLADDGAKLVFVNGALNALEVPSVGVDERVAGEMATTHLLDLRHRHIGFVAGPENYLPVRLKASGRAAALAAAGFGAADELVAHGPFSVAGGRAGLAALLERRARPTGIICSSDVIAIGVLLEARARGIRVPEELSIVGFDGIQATTWTDPPLTTIEQPIREIADTAVANLQALIDDGSTVLPNSYYRPTLRVRGTTAPAER